MALFILLISLLLPPSPLKAASDQLTSHSSSVIHSLPRHSPYAPHSPYPGPYSPSPLPYPQTYPTGLQDSAVFRNPYEQPGPQELDDAIRTQDSDLAIPNHYVAAYNPAPLPVHHVPQPPHHVPQPHGPVLHHVPQPIPHVPQPVHHLPKPVALHGPAVHHVEQVLTHHHLKEYHPYQYDISKIPECAYTNQHYYNLTFCLQDDFYPVDTIKHELERNKPLVDRILSDITYQSADNLVDGLTKGQEEGYTYKHYYGSTKHQTYTDDYQGYTYAKEYYKEGGYLCPSDIFYGRPKRAVNTYNKWKVIVNLPDEYYAKGYGAGYEKYTQTQRLEQCMYPDAPCSFIDRAFHSSCLQKHNFVRLLAYTYEEGLHIDSFKLPISCSCHVSQPRHPYGYAKHPSYAYTPAPPGYQHSPTPVPSSYQHSPTPFPPTYQYTPAPHHQPTPTPYSHLPQHGKKRDPVV